MTCTWPCGGEVVGNHVFWGAETSGTPHRPADSCCESPSYHRQGTASRTVLGIDRSSPVANGFTDASSAPLGAPVGSRRTLCRWAVLSSKEENRITGRPKWTLSSSTTSRSRFQCEGRQCPILTLTFDTRQPGDWRGFRRRVETYPLWHARGWISAPTRISACSCCRWLCGPTSRPRRKAPHRDAFSWLRPCPAPAAAIFRWFPPDPAGGVWLVGYNTGQQWIVSKLAGGVTEVSAGPCPLLQQTARFRHPTWERPSSNSLRRRGSQLGAALAPATGLAWRTVAGFQKLSENNA